MTRLAAHRLRIARDAAIREGRHDLRLIIDQTDDPAPGRDQCNRIDADHHRTR